MFALRCFWAGPLLVSALMVGPASVRAQEVDPRSMVMAQSLYDQAADLMDAKNYADACPKLVEVTKLVPKGIGGRLALAECLEGLGRLASAWEQYVQVESLARAAGESATVSAVQMQAAKLKPQLATLTIVVSAEMRGVAGLWVSFDGLPHDEAVWNTPIPVDTGKHTIEVKALGRQTWERVVTVVGNGVAVEVKVPALKVAADADSASSARSGVRTAGFVGMGLGAAGLGVGAILGGMAIARNGESNEGHCKGEDRCSRVGYDLRKEALSLGNGSTAAFVVGGLVLAVGVTLFVVSQPGSKGKEGAGAKASLVVGPGGVGLRGAW